MVLGLALSFNNSLDVLTLCSSILMAPMFVHLELQIGGFMNYVDSKLPRVTKSFVNKSFTKVVRKCFRINFFKLEHFLKKSMACVNIIQS